VEVYHLAIDMHIALLMSLHWNGSEHIQFMALMEDGVFAPGISRSQVQHPEPHNHPTSRTEKAIIKLANAC